MADDRWSSSVAPMIDDGVSGTSGDRPSGRRSGEDRPNSVAFTDSDAMPAGIDGARDGMIEYGRPGTRPSSVLLIDEQKERTSRPRTVTLVNPRDTEETPIASTPVEPKMPHELQERLRDSLQHDDLEVEQQIKDLLQTELQAVSKKSAGKEIVQQEYHPIQEARVSTAGKSKPSTARDSRSRGQGQPKSRGMPGTIGILWKEVYRPVVAPTTADNGYRHVLSVTNIVPGGAAEATGRVKIGDKLVAVQDAGQRNRKVVVGMKKDEMRRALHGDAGLAIALELLRATDMGAKKAFLVNLVRTPKMKADETRLPQIGKSTLVPPTPSIKQTGWARGVRLRGDMAPGDGDLKEYHSLSEEEGRRRGSDQDEGGVLQDDGGADEGADGDEEVMGNDMAREQARLTKVKKLKVSYKLTRKEQEQLQVMKKHKQQLDEESEKHAMREVYLLAAIHACEEELLKARELFCDVARRATGNPLVYFSRVM